MDCIGLGLRIRVNVEEGQERLESIVFENRKVNESVNVRGIKENESVRYRIESRLGLLMWEFYIYVLYLMSGEGDDSRPRFGGTRQCI